MKYKPNPLLLIIKAMPRKREGLNVMFDKVGVIC